MNEKEIKEMLYEKLDAAFKREIKVAGILTLGVEAEMMKDFEKVKKQVGETVMDWVVKKNNKVKEYKLNSDIMTPGEVDCCRRIGRDEENNCTTIGLPEIDALCASHEILRAKLKRAKDRISDYEKEENARATACAKSCAEDAERFSKEEVAKAFNDPFYKGFTYPQKHQGISMGCSVSSFAKSKAKVRVDLDIDSDGNIVLKSGKGSIIKSILDNIRTPSEETKKAYIHLHEDMLAKARGENRFVKDTIGDVAKICGCGTVQKEPVNWPEFIDDKPKYDTEIDISRVELTNTCTKCKQDYPYTDPVAGFICWGCRSGF